MSDQYNGDSNLLPTYPHSFMGLHALYEIPAMQR